MQFLFVFTLLVSSVLLFWVQPMFSKMVLPALGGTPAVWNTCLVFYQATLLLGYLYAHLTATWMRLRSQIFLHVFLMWSILLIMSFRFDLVPPSQSSPILWLLRVFCTSIGPPFFVLSATAPMLQWWFGHTDRPNARNPYVFYAISNFGSLAALLSYPVCVEPFLRLKTQNWVWGLSYGFLALLLSGCAVWMWWVLQTERKPADQGRDYKDRDFPGESENSPPGRGQGWVKRLKQNNLKILIT